MYERMMNMDKSRFYYHLGSTCEDEEISVDSEEEKNADVGAD